MDGLKIGSGSQEEMPSCLAGLVGLEDREFPCPADKRVVDDVLERWREVGVSEKKRKLLQKIKAHVDFLRKERRMGYSIGEEMLSGDEVKDLLEGLGKTATDFHLNWEMPPSFHSQLIKGYNLSACQVSSIEEMISMRDGLMQEKSQGVVFFPGSVNVRECAQRTINFALGRGRKNDGVSGEDLINVREKYWGAREGKINLNPLWVDLQKVLLSPKFDCRSLEEDGRRGPYLGALKILEGYLESADPEEYLVTLRKLVPWKIVDDSQLDLYGGREGVLGVKGFSWGV